MIKISYPEPDFKIKQEQGKQYIFDEVRRQWVRFTPEEWIRQNFIRYLHYCLQYPLSLIAVEKKILLRENNLERRCDIVVYKEAAPWMIVECKKQGIKLTDDVLMQALNYNLALKVPYIVITNGEETYALDTINQIMLQTIPHY